MILLNFSSSYSTSETPSILDRKGLIVYCAMFPISISLSLYLQEQIPLPGRWKDSSFPPQYLFLRKVLFYLIYPCFNSVVIQINIRIPVKESRDFATSPACRTFNQRKILNSFDCIFKGNGNQPSFYRQVVHRYRQLFLS